MTTQILDLEHNLESNDIKKVAKPLSWCGVGRARVKGQ